LRQGAPEADVVADLMKIETEQMGLGRAPDVRDRAKAVVAAILADADLWNWPDEQGRFR
jgi:hypothetical protein